MRVRARRAHLGKTQVELSAAAQVSRRWLSDLEAGKPTAEVGLVFRVLHALGLSVLAVPAETTRGRDDLDDVIRAHSDPSRSPTVTDDSNRRLVVLLDRHVVGDVAMAATGRLSFEYDEAWRTGDNRIPLSLSMSLSQQRHGDAPVRAFLAGLLPDNERVLERWARDASRRARCRPGG